MYRPMGRDYKSSSIAITVAPSTNCKLGIDVDRQTAEQRHLLKAPSCQAGLTIDESLYATNATYRVDYLAARQVQQHYATNMADYTRERYVLPFDEHRCTHSETPPTPRITKWFSQSRENFITVYIIITLQYSIMFMFNHCPEWNKWAVTNYPNLVCV